MLESEFMRRFHGEDPDQLRAAFEEHRDRSPFFPAVSEIVEIMRVRKARLRESTEVERRRQEREELQKARADGKLVDFADVRERITEIVKRMPDTPQLKRWHSRKDKETTGVVTPAVVLSPEQIMAEVEKERNDPKMSAEIARYRDETA